MTKEQRLLMQAEKIAQSVETWADLSNELYDPVVGILSTGYSDMEERHVFMKTEEYAKIQSLLTDAMNRFGVIEGATPKRRIGLLAESPWNPDHTAILLEIPTRLHQALDKEAAAVGVSFQELVVNKLDSQMANVA